ncbi:MAG TPA: hypothetical protein VHB73_00845 [Alphaproteobacteria bacterium]|nr:hypothetical protein [Alphaproteobacteria bacterium]
MSMMDIAAWSLIAGLSFLSVGGLLIWTYGDCLQSSRPAQSHAAVNARKNFMGVLIYSVAMTVAGLGMLVQGTFFLLHAH